ncbi:MAG: hypothetical protein II811_05110 [Spirochaetaceae bacterium]|nr:hypothetical protein [Spirochaetaceae bacterium]
MYTIFSFLTTHPAARPVYHLAPKTTPRLLGERSGAGFFHPERDSHSLSSLVESFSPDEESISTDRDLLSTGGEFISSSGESFSSSGEFISTDVETLSPDEEFISTGGELLSTDGEFISTSRAILSTNGAILSPDEESISTDRDILSTDRESLATDEKTERRCYKRYADVLSRLDVNNLSSQQAARGFSPLFQQTAAIGKKRFRIKFANDSKSGAAFFYKTAVVAIIRL